MKKYFLSTFSAVCISAAAIAQIPNASFENWTSMGSYNNPDNWDQLNGATTSTGVYTCVKGTPGNPGSSYIKLTSKTAGSMGVVPGLAVSGVIDMVTMKPKSGFAFSQMPVSLTGSWQYMASGADNGFVAVYLTKWNTGIMKRDTIAKGIQTLSGMAMSWANFSLNLNYITNNMPDSAMIVLSSSGRTPVANSYLYVDNLAFSGSVTGIKNINSYLSNISLYPNPSSGSVTVELNVQKTSPVKLQLSDVTGKIMKEISAGEVLGNYKTTLNTVGLSQGTYFLKITANDAVEVKKILIN
jgi:hypothetical protein